MALNHTTGVVTAHFASTQRWTIPIHLDTGGTVQVKAANLMQEYIPPSYDDEINARRPTVTGQVLTGQGIDSFNSAKNQFSGRVRFSSFTIKVKKPRKKEHFPSLTCASSLSTSFLPFLSPSFPPSLPTSHLRSLSLRIWKHEALNAPQHDQIMRESQMGGDKYKNQACKHLLHSILHGSLLETDEMPGENAREIQIEYRKEKT